MSIKNDRKKRDITKIIERMCDAVGAANPNQLSKYLGIKAHTINGWVSQGAVPYAYIDVISEKTNKPFEWFLDGSYQSTVFVSEPSSDPYISNVTEMMRSMDDDTKKDIQLSVQKEKLLRDLIKERQNKEAA